MIASSLRGIYSAERRRILPEQPNDEEEQDCMDLLHHVYGLLLKRELHLAPISESLQRVLDMGTGTGEPTDHVKVFRPDRRIGFWAMDFGEYAMVV